MGNIISYNDSVNGNWSSIGYDTLNRIALASQTLPSSGQVDYFCWNYDAFGNRLQQIETTGSGFQSGSGGAGACSAESGATLLSTSIASFVTNNQMGSTNARGVIIAPSYDASGNMNSDGANQYMYDAEGRICAVQGAPIGAIAPMTGYLYNADGQRVAKGTITTMSCDPTVNGFQMTENYMLGPGGEQLTTTDGSGNWLRTNVYAGTKVIATYEAVSDATQPSPSQMAAFHFQLTDPLGTRRLQTSSVGQPETDCQSLPFGDQQYCFPDQYAPGTADDATPLHFTGKERDSESGNDYFGARYYSSAMGRFMSPDWSAKEEPVPYAKLDNPQSLNLYAYVLNDPLSRQDPDGHSSLEYDGKTHTLTLYDKNGNTVGSWHANNRVDSHATLHGLPDGKYSFADTTKATHHSGVDKHGTPVESEKGEYGPFGIFHLKGFNADGSHHDGVGVHSGREDVPDASAQHGGGPDHVTQGCVRTTDAAMSQITDTAKTDPLTNLTVENNRPPQPQPPQQPPPPPQQEKQP